MSDQMAFFDGYEVQERKVKIPGIKDAMSIAGLFGPDQEVHIGDAFEVTMRFKVAMDAPGGKFDGSGTMTTPFAMNYAACFWEEGFRVNQYVSREELNSAWEETA